MCDLFSYSCFLVGAMKHGCWSRCLWWKHFPAHTFHSDIGVSLLIVSPGHSSVENSILFGFNLFFFFLKKSPFSPQVQVHNSTWTHQMPLRNHILTQQLKFMAPSWFIKFRGKVFKQWLTRFCRVIKEHNLKIGFESHIFFKKQRIWHQIVSRYTKLWFCAPHPFL